MRDRLSELIQSAVGGCAKYWADVIADKLLSEGVIVPPKMTDNEIIKAVECCSKGDCDHCPNDDKKRCIGRTTTDALALIKRLQSENARLTAERDHTIRKLSTAELVKIQGLPTEGL